MYVSVGWMGRGEWGWGVRMLRLGSEDVRVGKWGCWGWEVRMWGLGSEGYGDSFSDTEWRRHLIPFKWRSTLIPFKWRRTIISLHRVAQNSHFSPPSGAELSFLSTEWRSTLISLHRVAQNSHFSPTRIHLYWYKKTTNCPFGSFKYLYHYWFDLAFSFFRCSDLCSWKISCEFERDSYVYEYNVVKNIIHKWIKSNYTESTYRVISD